MSKSVQASYWSNRYSAEPDWNGGIHIGKFDGLGEQHSLEEACDAADVWLTREISERCSLYRLVTGLKILEIGCGSGSLPKSMSSMLPKFEYLGFDPALEAIERAKERFKNLDNVEKTSKAKVTFLAQSCEQLLSDLEGNLVGFDDGFDLVIIREVFYLLSQAERDTVAKIIENHTTSGACLFFSDLVASTKSGVNVIDTHLYKRHFAKESPLFLTSTNELVVESWAKELISKSLNLISSSLDVDNNRIYKTYQSALAQEVKSSTNKESYQMLADLANPESEAGSELHYLSAMFQIGEPKHRPLSTNEVGFIANENWENVFISGQTYSLPKGKWSLLIGRSGTGKTSLINAILNEHPAPYNKSEANLLDSKDCFLFSQDIYLFENLSPVQNVSVFNKDKDEARLLLHKLGIRKEVIERKDTSKISGGERQRIALAQCIAANSPVLVLDEPFKGLDKSRRYVLFDIIEKEWGATKSEKSLICIDHDFEFIVGKFDHIFEMMNGYMIEMTPSR